MPVLNEVAEETIYYVDTEVDDISAIASLYNIAGVPEMLYFSDGVLTDQSSSDKYEIEAETYEEYFKGLYEEMFENNK